MRNKNLRRLRCLVTAQTLCNLERLAQADGCGDVGRMVDKLTREKMLSLHPETARLWAALVTAQTLCNLERLAQADGCGDVGRMVDKLTREKMLSLHPETARLWAAHYMGRFKRVD